MWLISSYPPVGGISGQINIFASHIVQVCFGCFFLLLTGYKSQYHIVLHQFPFFFILLLFCDLSEKAHGIHCLSFLQYVYFHSVVFLFRFQSLKFTCALQSLSLSCCMRIVILLWNSFQWNDYAILFSFYHCLFVVTSQLLCLFLETITIYIRCEGELMINWKEEKKLWKFSSSFHRNIANGFYHILWISLFLYVDDPFISNVTYQHTHTMVTIDLEWSHCNIFRTYKSSVR